jgi:pre-60S factor REI1
MEANINSVYNLKRQIASLPPISEKVFQKQVLESRAENTETETSSSFRQSCVACEQHYTNRKAWYAHLKSQNHIEKSAASSSKAPIAPDESLSPDALSLQSHDEDEQNEEEEEFRPLECLFCNSTATSLEANLGHMSLAHSFFIPDAEYLIDVESFLSYLFTVISVFHECLYCGTERSTKFAVQDHMRGKGHCKVDFDDDEHQLKQFYDFSGADGDVDGDEEEETEDEVTLVPDEDELRLPSGRILGHRSRARYFRQHHTEHASFVSGSQQQLLTEGASETGEESETVPTSAASTDRRLALRAGTSTSLVGVPELRQRAMIAVEHQIMKQEAAAKNEYQHVLERGGNKQKRFKVKSMGKKQGGLEKRLG